MNNSVISKELYFFFLDAGIPYEGWVDFGDGIYAYALKVVEVVGVPINKYNDHFVKMKSTSICVADNTHVNNPYKAIDEFKQNGFAMNSGLDIFGHGLNTSGGFGSGMKKTGGTFRLTNGTNNGNLISVKHYASSWQGGSRAGIKTYSMIKWGGKISKGATGINLIVGVYQISDGISKDDGTFGYNAQHATASVAGGTLGAAGGVALGAFIGSFFAGVGAIPGAAIGGFIGGFAGGWGGSEAGEYIYEEYVKK
ncbi:hypothetical protein FACS189426_02030 [Bacteroidia bacterium]|nr:hypothetical protein FACS189426_02030 [Bacteroidia bacterium]